MPLASSAESCRLARGTVRQLLDRADVDADTRDTAVLLATELASNAIEHGGGPALLDAYVRADAIRIAVADPSPVLPTPRPIADTADELSERGRGLLLVAALASRWGAEPHAHGKTVWCEIDLA
ncbi:ATP-binding protein [Nocardioides sp. CGMCC 1.13656]|nr:ATP-binding protein [Nocardioides sp. CGMCC 1.13656]